MPRRYAFGDYRTILESSVFFPSEAIIGIANRAFHVEPRADGSGLIRDIHLSGLLYCAPMTPAKGSVTPATLADRGQQTLKLAREVLEIEARGITALIDRLDDSFIRAHELMLNCRGRVVVTGMGKSGHIGGKIASTLASTGTPAFFMHPGEASHGDLGMITPDDVVLAMSNSGESSEILAILPSLKRRGVALIAMTGSASSTMAREADVHLNAAVDQEACPLNLAPTASTTAALALGDALAVTLLDARGFGADDFARTHPGGILGRRLLVHVEDVMHTGVAIPKVLQGAMLSAALLEMSKKRLGMTAIVDDDDRLLGVFTDGDLRRALDKPIDVRSTPIDDLMTRNPRTIGARKLAAEAAQIMQQNQILVLLVTDDAQRVIGAFSMHDLLRAGVV
jgi:arabinose-5-phosphate isomerase